jgi:large subunit ribosomal protein L21e
MVTRIGTKQRKTRHKYRASIREKGKVPLSRFFQTLKDGDAVNLVTHPNVQKGRFFPRFHGLSGTVTGKKGSCYGVKIKDGGKQKLLYIHPIHLKKHIQKVNKENLRDFQESPMRDN